MASNFDPSEDIPREFPPGAPQKSYELSGKIMLSAIVILFGVVVFMVCLHLYARWYLLRARRRQLLRRSRSRRRTQLVFYVDPNAAAPIHGLDASVLGSLPVFVFSSKTHPEEEVLECAVCLSEFEENEKGRQLPKCNHRFHTECIDMWFHSHSTCPICRSPVEAQILPPVTENRSDVVISVGLPVESEPGSSSGMCSACQHDDQLVAMPSSSSSSSSSVEARRKGLDLVRVTIEIPRRNESEDELRLSSPASQGFRSPGARLLSLKRILSMNMRSPSSVVSPSAGVGTSCWTQTQSTELDIERGIDESTQSLTPR